MDTNHEEAIRAREEGKQKFAEGDYQKAVKLFQISIRLHPNADTSQLLHSAQAALVRISSNQSNSAPNSSSQWYNPVVENFCRYLEPLLQLESRLISPDFKPYVRGMILVIFMLSCYKLLVKHRLSLFDLPGDFNYSSPNVIVHAPIVSCLLISFLANAVNRAFQHNN